MLETINTDNVETDSESETEINTDESANGKNPVSQGAIVKHRDKKPEAIKLLKEKYNDLTGWIEIDNTVVNFPVMQSGNSDPDYYLRRDFKGNYSKYGSIYLDASCTDESDVLLLYGHSMSDKRMFYCLLDMAEPEVLKNSPIIKYDTISGIGDYKIVSIFKTNTRYSHGSPFHYNYIDFDSTEEKMQYIYDCMIRSVVDTGVDIKDDDEFILLSTCSYEFEDFRTGVLARKVRPDEESSVDINNIKKAESPLYPDVWYETYGGRKPDYPEKFEDAVKDGILYWYSGELYK
jgi:sortase B